MIASYALGEKEYLETTEPTATEVVLPAPAPVTPTPATPAELPPSPTPASAPPPPAALGFFAVVYLLFSLLFTVLWYLFVGFLGYLFFKNVVFKNKTV